jgi:hypothetical protein
VQHPRLAVATLCAGAADEEQIGTLGLDREANLGDDFDVRRSAIADEVGEREVPEVVDELHGPEA